METIGRIRRAHLLHGKSIREVARELGISRNTVRKVLRSDETSHSYEREIQPRPKLGRWKTDIDGMLTKNADATAPTTMITATLMYTLRRPRTSATRPNTKAPTNAPRIAAPVTQLVWVVERFHCSFKIAATVPMTKRSYASVKKPMPEIKTARR